MTTKRKIKALYIHIPFCEHLCDYCDFTKVQYFSLFARPYIDELKKELDSYDIPVDELETVYIGGGTPTSLEDDLFLKLLEIVEPYIHNVKEYTVEANPESLTLNKLKMMKEHGVNRLSIGVETTNDEILKAINRHHTYKDVKTAILNAKKVGLDNLNVDLILGLPGSSLVQIKDDLDNLMTLDVQHISCYSLTVHPNTIFYLKGIPEPLDDESRNYYDLVNGYFLEHGFEHYEVSNWCKKGHESQHNLVYWNNQRYYGVGLGASGYIDNFRYTNTKSINIYLKGLYRYGGETLDENDEMQYQIMLNLRTKYGIDLDIFKMKYGVDLYEQNKSIIDEFVSQGLLILKNKHLIATYEGMMILDQIILKLI